jgi:hypothetical protein
MKTQQEGSFCSVGNSSISIWYFNKTYLIHKMFIHHGEFLSIPTYFHHQVIRFSEISGVA